jgi:hypothetical protein
MSDTGNDPVQQPAATPEGRRIEEFALRMLRQVLRKSLHGGPDGRPREWGGMIYVDNRNAGPAGNGPLGFTRYEGDSPIHVSVHDKEPNRGCPPGTTPVAWYHTHPTAEMVTNGGDYFTTRWREFIDGDKELSDKYLLPGYVATWDQRFWRYDPPPQAIVDGKPFFNDGLPVSDASKEGYYGVLKPKVVPL